MEAFLEGLKLWLARELKLKQPRHLQEAIKMVKILKDSYYAKKCQGKDGQVGKSFKTPWKEKETLEEPTKDKKDVIKLSKDEVQECIKKGLCFKCGEK